MRIIAPVGESGEVACTMRSTLQIVIHSNTDFAPVLGYYVPELLS